MHFNILFGKKPLDKQLLLTREEFLTHFNKYVENYKIRRELALTFNYARVGDAMRSWDALLQTLETIEKTIPRALVILEDEEMDEKTLLAELKQTERFDHQLRTNLLFNRVVKNVRDPLLKGVSREQALQELLKQLYFVLQGELTAVKRIREAGKNSRDLLLHLFDLIHISERRVLQLFDTYPYPNDNEFARVVAAAHAVLLGEKAVIAAAGAEEAFEEKILDKMGKTGSKNSYRKLAESIFFALAEHAGGPFAPKDVEAGLDKMAELSQNEIVLQEIVAQAALESKLELTKNELLIVSRAFKLAFERGHFTDLEHEID